MAEWGDKLEFLESLADEDTIPHALKNRPVVPVWLKEYVEGFNVLDSTRQYGMGPNPIQLSEMLAYIQLTNPEDKEAFIEYILKMDASFLEAKSQRAEREASQKAKQDGKG